MTQCHQRTRPAERSDIHLRTKRWVAVLSPRWRNGSKEQTFTGRVLVGIGSYGTPHP